MRIIRFQGDSGQTHHGIETQGQQAELVEFDPTGTFKLISRTARIVKRLAPIEPTNIYCIGLNYRAHAQETGAAIPEQPVVFMKPTTAVANPGDPILIPRCCTHGDEVDYEVELAVVIGKVGRNIPEEQALDYVMGYTVANDVSARRWQKHSGGGQWIRGKSFDSFCPLGPVLVTRDEIPDPQSLSLSTTLNGSVMQSSNTSDMIFTVARLIAFISMDTTLLPNTLILTGTPQGVGVARKPPVFLKPGDTVKVEIDKIGAITSNVEQG
ncbi:MAG: 5-carboxymethyl-2-hydroxymuconate isomerase [Phycisphaera sp.]|nr:5-carboxymethyl-2-hydroxymuconate isomerase [Phycisphaera sp.]